MQLHGKICMWQIIDAFQAKKIFFVNYITSTTNAIVADKKNKKAVMMLKKICPFLILEL
jgi:hypothetical protein